MNLFIGNLSPETTEDALRQAFVEFGVVLSVKIPIDNATGLPRGFGFVEMEDKFHALDAIDNLDTTYFQGNIISVKESKPKNQAGGGNNRFGGSGNRQGGGGFNRGGGGNRQGGGSYNRNNGGGSAGGYSSDRAERNYNNDRSTGGYNRERNYNNDRSTGGYNRERNYNNDNQGYNNSQNNNNNNDDDKFNRL